MNHNTFLIQKPNNGTTTVASCFEGACCWGFVHSTRLCAILFSHCMLSNMLVTLKVFETCVVAAMLNQI